MTLPPRNAAALSSGSVTRKKWKGKRTPSEAAMSFCPTLARYSSMTGSSVTGSILLACLLKNFPSLISLPTESAVSPAVPISGSPRRSKLP